MTQRQRLQNANSEGRNRTNRRRILQQHTAVGRPQQLIDDDDTAVATELKNRELNNTHLFLAALDVGRVRFFLSSSPETDHLENKTNML